jgi:hypothetical protein
LSLTPQRQDSLRTSSSFRLPIASTRSTPSWTSKMTGYSPAFTRE